MSPKIKVETPKWERPDPLKIENKDPKFEYRVLRDDPQNITLKQKNWKILTSEDKEVCGYKAPDGTRKFGNMVFAKCPKSVLKDRERQLKDMTDRIIEGNKAALGREKYKGKRVIFESRE